MPSGVRGVGESFPYSIRPLQKKRPPVSEVNSFKLWKNQLLLSQLTLKNVLDLFAGSHQIVSLAVVKGGKDGTDAVGDDVHVVRSLFNPAQVNELGELTANGFTRDTGNVRN